jgi:UDP:flavonoid glycosyltransferase YjiC (YdhE family)
MRILLVTTGSLGDIRPFVALALGLRRAGHEVRLAAPRDASALAEQYNLEFQPVDLDHQERLARQANSGTLEGGNTLRFGLQRMQDKQRIFQDVNLAAWQVCEAADLIIYRIGGFLAVDSMAEKLGVPCFKAGLVPYSPTAEYPNLRLDRGQEFGKAANRLSHFLAEGIVWQFFRPEINRFRRQVLGLPPFPLSGPSRHSISACMPVIYAFSPTILPPPADWPANVHITGSWELDQSPGWMPPQALLDFLDAGPPPVYIGFGSMPVGDPQATYHLVREALRLCDQRAVLAGAWAQAYAGVDKRIFTLDSAPHAWLFPRVAAAVHHGGVGTLTAALRAGLPMVIVPFNYDQPFWGARARRLGVCPPPIPRRKLSTERLAEGLGACLSDPAMRQRAEQAARQIRAEDGVGKAMDIIRQHVAL